MPRLIDADDIIKKAVPHTRGEHGYSADIRKWAVLVGDIKDAPTVDAVEVVRCRNCIHYDFGVCLKIYSDGGVSQYAWQERNEDDFCSYGKRKGGDTKC